MRDDNVKRQRVAVPIYKLTSQAGIPTHKLGLANDIPAAEPELSEVYKGFYTRRARTKYDNYGDTDIQPVPDSIGDLADCYLAGAIVGKGLQGQSVEADFPHGLYPVTATGTQDTTKRAYYDKVSRGRGNIGFISPSPGRYPDVPWATLLAEFIELVPPDTEDPMDPHSRIYGRININAAPKEVLACLPFPKNIKWTDDAGQTFTLAVDPEQAAQYLIDYRINVSRPTIGLIDGGFAGAHASGPGALRTHLESDIKGFLTPGEAAIPLAAYAESLINSGGDAELRKNADYLRARDSLYWAVGNLISANSATFVVNIRIERGSGGHGWYYVAIIDRSSCQSPKQAPAVMLFAEVK